MATLVDLRWRATHTMPPGWRCRAQAVLVGWLLLPMWSAAQAPESAPSQTPDAPVAADSQQTEPPLSVRKPFQFVGPDTYILLDKEGNPQPFLGMTYEDFVAAWKQLQKLDTPDAKRRYTLERLDVRGTAQGAHAALTIVAEVLLLTAEPVDVQLGMSQAILRQPPSGTQAEAGEYVRVDSKSGGYVAHLQGTAGERRTLELDVYVPIERDATANSLRLGCPRAATSTLELQLPTVVASATSSVGSQLEVEEDDQGHSRMKVTGPAGDFQLSWQSQGAPDVELASVLSVASAMRATIDGRSIRTQVWLTVESFGGSFDEFRLRLPPGARLVRTRPDDAADGPPPYTVVAAGHERRDPNGNGDNIVIVRLRQKQRGPVEIVLTTQQPLGLESADLSAELAGFEVLGAVRQYGDVAVEVNDAWQLRWEVGRYARQVEVQQLPSQLAEATPVAAFQFDRQPWSLKIRVVPRETRVVVNPQYQLVVDREGARLRTELNYSIPSAPALEFRIDLNGWEVTEDAIEPQALIERELYTPGGQMHLRLTRASPRSTTIVFYARRAWVDSDEASWPLPEPLADTVGLGDIEVFSHPGIQLAVEAEKSVGLASRPIADGQVKPDGLEHYHEQNYRTYRPDPTLALRRRVEPREITVQSSTTIDFATSATDVTQDLTYHVRYEPLSRLRLSVPTALLEEDEAVTFSQLATVVDPATGEQLQQETPLEWSLSTTTRNDADRATSRVQLTLPHPQLGVVRLRARYRQPLPETIANDARIDVRLVSPLDGQLTTSRARVDASPTVRVALRQDAQETTWRAARETPSADHGQQVVEAYSHERETALPLTVFADRPPELEAPAVERVWLQMWLAGGLRQDRAVYRFRTAGDQIAIELPPDANSEHLTVLLDGREVVAGAEDAGRLLVSLPAAESSDTHTLELRFRRRLPTSALRQVEWTPPQIAGAYWTNQVYWQIVVPGDTHLVGTPNQVSPANAGTWLENLWNARPAMSQAELEHWTGAAELLGPTASENQYLLSGLAPTSSLVFTTAERWLIVLVVSGCVLAVGLLVIYLRSFWVPLLLAIAGLATIAISPELAFFVAWAGALGMVLVAAAYALHRLVATDQGSSTISLPGSTASLSHPTARSDTFLAAPVGSHPSNTPIPVARASDSRS